MALAQREWHGWVQNVAVGVEFAMTLAGPPQFNDLARRFGAIIEAQGLPNTFLGDSWPEVGESLASIVGRGLRVADQFSPNARVLTGEAVRPATEYDFQNLIATVLRPWIPSLERETVAVVSAGQRKIVDFGALSNKLLIEAKHMSRDSMAGIIKTLAGLSDFYESNPNVRLLLFLILVEADVNLDDDKVQEEFSYETQPPYVVTRLYRNPVAL